MNEAVVLGLGREALYTAALISAPLLGVSLFLGVTVSIIQAVTQVNEMTLTFVPKFIGAAVVLIVLGPWMLEVILGFTATIFTDLGSYGR
jgi:flagellar biosynthetic protein FliQ